MLERARMPVLMAIQGGCVGGAVDFATACDCRYATEDAFFVIQEINIGMTADVGTFPRLCKLIPEGVVKELAYAGRRMGAKRAMQVGLVNEVFATQDEMLKQVMIIAQGDRGEITARRAWLQGDDQLCARPFHCRRPRLHRDMAGRHVQPRNRHARKLRGKIAEAPAAICRPAAAEKGLGRRLARRQRFQVMRQRHGGTVGPYLGEGHAFLFDDFDGVLITFGHGLIEFFPVAQADVRQRAARRDNSPCRARRGVALPNRRYRTASGSTRWTACRACAAKQATTMAARRSVRR